MTLLLCPLQTMVVGNKSDATGRGAASGDVLVGAVDYLFSFCRRPRSARVADVHTHAPAPEFCVIAGHGRGASGTYDDLPLSLSARTAHLAPQ